MHYFIIEHPVKGTLTAIPGDRDDKYHFSWSNLRSDERNVRLYAKVNAIKMRDLVRGAYGDDRFEAVISDGWKAV